MSRFLPFAVSSALITASTALAQVAPAAPKADTAEEQVVLSPFLVKSIGDKGYAARDAMGASRVALPVSDTPVTILSITEELLADRGAVDAMEVLPLISGVQRAADSAPGQEQFSLRGFAITGLSIRDGLPENMAAADNPFDDGSAYERLEVIKGPAGTLYGTTSMGGVINKVSKWPRFAPSTKLELQAQSYDEFVRAMIDSTGPVGDKTAYRVVLSDRIGDRYYNGGGPNDFFNSLVALTHLLGEKGKSTGRIWTRLQYLKFNLARENGVQFPTGFLDPLNPTVPKTLTNPKFPISKETNNLPNDPRSKANIHSYEGGYEQSFQGPFQSNWTMRLVGRYSDGKGDKTPTYAQGRPTPVNSAGQIVTYTNAAGAQVAGDNRFIGADDPRVADWRASLTVRDFGGYNKASGGFLDLVGDFQTGPLKHKMVINGQFTETVAERAFFFWAVPNPSNTTAVANSFSVVNANFSNIDFKAIKAGTPQFNAFNGHSEADGFAAGFQDNISILSDKIIGVIGTRYDRINTTTFTFNSAQSIAQRRFVADPTTTRTISNQDTTFKYGLVGKPMEGLSIFGQVGQTYIPVSSLNAAGVKNPNQEGEIKEVGIKTDLFQGRLSATASVFDMELTNVLVSVPLPIEQGGGTTQVPIGKQKTKGWEIDLAAEPIRGLTLVAGYSDIDSKDELGRSFRAVPTAPSYSLLAKYAFSEGGLRGAFVGGSFKHNARAAGDATNLFFIDENNMFDGFVGYGRGKWRVQVNVLNLGNSNAPLTSVSDTAVFRALDRMYRLTFTYQL